MRPLRTAVLGAPGRRAMGPAIAIALGGSRRRPRASSPQPLFGDLARRWRVWPAGETPSRSTNPRQERTWGKCGPTLGNVARDVLRGVETTATPGVPGPSAQRNGAHDPSTRLGLPKADRGRGAWRNGRTREWPQTTSTQNSAADAGTRRTYPPRLRSRGIPGRGRMR